MNLFKFPCNVIHKLYVFGGIMAEPEAKEKEDTGKRVKIVR